MTVATAVMDGMVAMAGTAVATDGTVVVTVVMAVTAAARAGAMETATANPATMATTTEAGAPRARGLP